MDKIGHFKRLAPDTFDVQKNRSAQVRESATLWTGTCALVLGVGVLGAWQVWLGLLLSLPLLLGGFGYALTTLVNVKAQHLGPKTQATTLNTRELRAARFASPAQTLTLAVGVALLLNLILVAISGTIMLLNAGYVGSDYELSAIYVRAGETLLPALGSLAALSVLALTAGSVYNWSPRLRAAENAAVASAPAARAIKFARVFNTVVLVIFLGAAVLGLVGFVILQRLG